MLITETVGIIADLPAGTPIGIGFSRDFLKQYTVTEYAVSPTRTVIRVKEITTPEEAQALADNAVYVRATDVLKHDERHSVGDIEGCTVVDEHGNVIGVVTEVMLLPANDVWIVTTQNGRNIPLPVIDDVILAVDVVAKQITAHILDGLVDLDISSDAGPDDE